MSVRISVTAGIVAKCCTLFSTIVHVKMKLSHYKDHSLLDSDAVHRGKKTLLHPCVSKMIYKKLDLFYLNARRNIFEKEGSGCSSTREFTKSFCCEFYGTVPIFPGYDPLCSDAINLLYH